MPSLQVYWFCLVCYDYLDLLCVLCNAVSFSCILDIWMHTSATAQDTHIYQHSDQCLI